MARQTREDYLQKKREYYHNHKDYFRQYWREHRESKIANQKRYMARYQVEYQEEYRKKMRDYQKDYGKRRKILVLSQYSNGEPTCAICGEKRITCLTIDHINGGGRAHRKSIAKRTGTPFYSWLRDNNYPEGYRVLCMNCQWVTYHSSTAYGQH